LTIQQCHAVQNRVTVTRACPKRQTCCKSSRAPRVATVPAGRAPVTVTGVGAGSGSAPLDGGRRAHDALERTQLVRRVEGGDLLGLRQRRVVEDRADEVVDRAAAAHHGLADVYQLGRARAEDVDAEQPPALRVDEQLQETVPVAEDLPAGELAVPR